MAQLLTPEEIGQILDGVQKVVTEERLLVSAYPEVVQVSMDNLLAHIESQLMIGRVKKFEGFQEAIITAVCDKIRPHPLKDTDIFRDPLLKPGSLVGITATEALCQPITQLTLKSFHNAGTNISMGNANSSVNEIVNGTMNRENLWSMIYFLPVMDDPDSNGVRYPVYKTWDEVYDLRAEFINTTLSDLIVNNPHNSTGIYRTTTNPIGDDDIDWWHHVYLRMYPDKAGIINNNLDGRVYHRLYLNYDLMIERRITVQDIVAEIEKIGCSIVIPGPMGIIDMVPSRNDTVLPDCPFSDISDLNDPVLINMYNCWINKTLTLFNVSMRGMVGINEMVPRTHNIIDIAFFGPKVKGIDIGGGKRYYPLNLKLMYTLGVKKERLLMALELYFADKGLSVVEDPIRSKYGIVIVGANDNTIFDLSKYSKSQDNENSLLGRMLRLVYAETSGINLNKTLIRDDVDPTMTMVNDFLETERVFGIESLRNNISLELNRLIKAGDGDFSPEHLMLLVDTMTYKGKFIGINFNGMSNQQAQTLPRAANERQFDTILKVATRGGTDQLVRNGMDITPVSTGILTGQMIQRYKDHVDPRQLLSRLKNGPGVGTGKLNFPKRKNIWTIDNSVETWEVDRVEKEKVTIDRGIEEDQSEQVVQQDIMVVDKNTLVEDNKQRYEDIGGY